MTKKQIYTLDEKRRITFPKDIQERYGNKFVVIQMNDQILLRPLPQDPIKALQQVGRKIGSRKQLRKDFEDILGKKM